MTIFYFYTQSSEIIHKTLFSSSIHGSVTQTVCEMIQRFLQPFFVHWKLKREDRLNLGVLLVPPLIFAVETCEPSLSWVQMHFSGNCPRWFVGISQNDFRPLGHSQHAAAFLAQHKICCVAPLLLQLQKQTLSKYAARPKVFFVCVCVCFYFSKCVTNVKRTGKVCLVARLRLWQRAGEVKAASGLPAPNGSQSCLMSLQTVHIMFFMAALRRFCEQTKGPAAVFSFLHVLYPKNHPDFNLCVDSVPDSLRTCINFLSV